MSRYYGNVKYSILFLLSNRGDKTETHQVRAMLKNLQQYTTYSVRVQAVTDGKVVVKSGWMTVRTSGEY